MSYPSSSDGAGPTAFRAAEKQYQLRYNQVVKRGKNGRAKGTKLQVRPTDLSGVVDVASASKLAELGAQVVTQHCPELAANIYTFPGHPGLFVIPGALAPAQQCQLIEDALTAFPSSPNQTNHTPQHGLLPQQPSLWEAALQGLCLQPPQQPGAAVPSEPGQPATESNSEPPRGEEEAPAAAIPGLRGCGKWVPVSSDKSSGGGGGSSNGGRGAISAATVLRTLRWVTLGPPYDWTARRYRKDLQYSPLPQYLADLAVQLAAAVTGLGGDSTTGSGGSTDGSSNASSGSEAVGQGQGPGVCGCAPAPEPASPVGCSPAAGSVSSEPFQPDVALVNYYHEGDTLGGHCDDAERNLSHPLVTLSLGCEAVFLKGGLTRDTPPLALLVRSGDAVVMAGEARRCFHGVPRIFTDRPLPAALEAAAAAEVGGVGGSSFSPFLEHMRGCRINISVREAA